MHVKIKTAITAVGIASLASGVFLASDVAAQASFEGERITFMVPFGEGGAADIYTRTVAASLTEYLPGNPTIVVQNYPGAGGTVGANAFENEAEPDGLTVLSTSPSTLVSYMLGADGVQYEMRDYIPVVVTPQGAVAYVRSEVGIRSDLEEGNLEEVIETINNYGVVYGDSSPTAGPLRFILSMHLLGVDIKTVWGLSGGGPRRQAFMRGEFQLNYESANAYEQRIAPLVESGEVDDFFTFGMLENDGSIGRDPNYPSIPTFLEYYEAVHGETPSGPEWEAWNALYFASTIFNKALWLPKGTPDEIVEAYSTALEELFQDEEFRSGPGAEIVASGTSLFGPERADPLAQDRLVLTPEARGALETFLQEEYDVNL